MESPVRALACTSHVRTWSTHGWCDECQSRPFPTGPGWPRHCCKELVAASAPLPPPPPTFPPLPLPSPLPFPLPSPFPSSFRPPLPHPSLHWDCPLPLPMPSVCQPYPRPVHCPEVHCGPDACGGLVYWGSDAAGGGCWALGWGCRSGAGGSAFTSAALDALASFSFSLSFSLSFLRSLRGG